MFDALPPARRALAIDAHRKLHALWTKTDGPAYVKSEWQALEAALEALACDFATPASPPQAIYFEHGGDMPFGDFTCNRCGGRRVGIGDYTAICTTCIAVRFEDEEQPASLSVVAPTKNRHGHPCFLLPRITREIDNPASPKDDGCG